MRARCLCLAVSALLTLAVSGLVLGPTSHARADAPLAPSAATAPPAPDRQASIANWIVAGALAGVAIFSITSSVYTALQSGTCIGVVEPDGRCTDRVDFGWRSAIFVSIGVTSLLTATFFVMMQPIRLSVSGSPEHAMLHLDTRF